MLPGLRAYLGTVGRFLSRSAAGAAGYHAVDAVDTDEDAEEREVGGGSVSGAIHTFRTRFGPLASSVLFLSMMGALFFVAVLSEQFSYGYEPPSSPVPVINASNGSTTVLLVNQNGTTAGWLTAPASSSIVTPAVTPITPSTSTSTAQAKKLLDTRKTVLFYWLMSLGLFSLLVAVLRTLLIMRRVFVSRRNGSGANAAASSRGANHNFDMALTELASIGAFRNLRGQLSMMQRELTANDYEMLSQLDNANPLHEGGAGGIPRGASEALINRMPLHHMTSSEIATKTDSNALTCSICLAPFEEGSLVRTVVCMHSFHKTCIDPWLRMRSSCPVCKIPITADGGGMGV